MEKRGLSPGNVVTELANKGALVALGVFGIGAAGYTLTENVARANTCECNFDWECGPFWHCSDGAGCATFPSGCAGWSDCDGLCSA